MNNRPIIITGCQRSGTTLLNLILDSHPQIRGVDEMEFRNDKLKEYLEHPDYHPCVSFKLPVYAHSVRSLKTLPCLKILWCVRDPRDVVLSMINLKLRMDDLQSVAWANHPYGAVREVEHCMQALGYGEGGRSFFGYAEYQRISQIPCLLRGRAEAVFMAALCWKLKNELLELYDRENISYLVVSYEDLIADPKPMLEKILSFLKLPWHDNVLMHHELHNGMSVGDTVNNKPIDASNTGKWKQALSNDEVVVIESICAGVAQKFGYRLSDATLAPASS